MSELVLCVLSFIVIQMYVGCRFIHVLVIVIGSNRVL